MKRMVLIVLALLAAGGDPVLAARGWTDAVKSRPGLRIPRVTVTARDPGVAPGFIFVTPRTIYPGQTGPAILDGDGHVVWFHRQSYKVSAQNLRPQTYQGKPVLTWSLRPPLGREGDALAGTAHNTYHVIADSSYRIIKRVRAKGRGVVTDSHDFVITPRNTALVIGGRYLRRDLSRYGGPARRSGIVDNLVQEIDLRTNRVLFSWSAARHVSLADAFGKPPASGPWDAFHLNSVSEDSDGNLLVSARITSTIYKIDRRSGRIIWKLGGKHSSFRFGRGADFWFQHDAARQPDGTITLFDNRATDLDKSHGTRSAGKRLRLDTKAKTATLVRAYAQPAAIGLSTSQGSLGVLAGGNAFVGWGISPWFSEFAPDGRLLFSAHFASVWHHSYRAYKAPWIGKPTGDPAVYARAGAGMVAAYVSWNGATDVAQWRLMGGPDKSSLAELVTVPRADFETKIAAPGTPAVVEVEGLDSNGAVIGRSPLVKPKQP